MLRKRGQDPFAGKGVRSPVTMIIRSPGWSAPLRSATHPRRSALEPANLAWLGLVSLGANLGHQFAVPDDHLALLVHDELNQSVKLWPRRLFLALDVLQKVSVRATHRLTDGLDVDAHRRRHGDQAGCGVGKLGRYAIHSRVCACRGKSDTRVYPWNV